ncbi:FG-GAP and VCBS repeat-containing protein [Streptomyces sp. NPDC060194]|uniref:FG-GAP and VCBS repeat-containing protein n=1 Tax=Streptomyces sp. NPDC060194 TaxID=3347069 RepID=UPI0036540563
MQHQFRTALATAAAVALTGGLLVVAAGTATAADPTKTAQADFNNDGFGDVAYSAGSSTVAGKKTAGQIVIVYGTPSGISSAKRQTFSQDSAGVPGTAETGDGFGWTSAYGDFNSDGFDDLAVGAQWEDVSGDTDGGTVVVLWGSASGLKGGTTVADPAPSAHDKWGGSLAAGDFNGDGKDDLAVGTTSNTVHVIRGGLTPSGATGGRYTVKAPIMAQGNGSRMLTAGDVTGDGRTDLVVEGFTDKAPNYFAENYFFPGSSSGLTASGMKKLKPGIITDIGDVNGDGYGDIVSGVDWDAVEDGVTYPGAHKGGQANITYGSASGPAASVAVHQETGAVPGGSETDDFFGGELSLGDINGDGFLDLAVGAYGEDLGSFRNAGSVTVLYGSARGLDTTGGIQYFHQDTPGVPGSSETDDGFGTEIKLDDLNGDGRADLAVSSAYENAGDGLVTYLPSDGTRITTAGSRTISPSAVGVSTAGTPLFGANAAN